MEGRLILLAFMVFVTPGTAQMNNTATGCGPTKLCVHTPDGCDPAVNQTCLFASVANISTMSDVTTLSFQLKGHSTGYIELMLQGKPPVNVSMDFMCGHNTSANGSFYFSWASTTMQMLNYQGSVAGDAIQCTFNVSVNISSSSNTSVSDLFNVTLRSVPLNLTSPQSTMAAAANGTMATTVNGTMATTVNGTMATNMTTAMTTAATTLATQKPAGASVALQPYAFLVFLSLVTLSILQKV